MIHTYIALSPQVTVWFIRLRFSVRVDNTRDISISHRHRALLARRGGRHARRAVPPTPVLPGRGRELPPGHQDLVVVVWDREVPSSDFYFSSQLSYPFL